MLISRDDFAELEGVEAFSSCSVTWQGRMLVFGGKNQYRQISEVTTLENRATCVLRNIGQLPFDYTMGACTESDNELFLCFDSGTPYACFRQVSVLSS